MKNKKGSSSGNKLQSPIINYLTPEFANAEFENPTVQSIAGEVISKLIETNDPQYLTTLAKMQSIYSEKIFWKQITRLKVRGFQGDKEAEKCLKAILKGFEIKIMPPAKPKGRPPRLIKEPLMPEYLRIRKKLNEIGVSNIHLNYTNEKDEIESRKKCLIEFINKNVINNKRINLSDRDINKLTSKTTSEIAKILLCKAMNLGIEKIKKQLALEHPRYVWELEATLSDGRVIHIPNSKYDAEWMETLQELQESNELDDRERFCEIMSIKLNVPIEAIKIIHFHEGGEPTLFFSRLRTPHKPKKSIKRKLR